MDKTNDEIPSSPLTVPSVFVCQYQSCLRNGASDVLAAFQALEIPGYIVQESDCQGQCSVGPTVRVIPEEIWYYRVKPTDVPLIVEQHLKGGTPVEALLNPRIHIRFSW